MKYVVVSGDTGLVISKPVSREIAEQIREADIGGRSDLDYVMPVEVLIEMWEDEFGNYWVQLTDTEEEAIYDRSRFMWKHSANRYATTLILSFGGMVEYSIKVK